MTVGPSGKESSGHSRHQESGVTTFAYVAAKAAGMVGFAIGVGALWTFAVSSTGSALIGGLLGVVGGYLAFRRTVRVLSVTPEQVVLRGGGYTVRLGPGDVLWVMPSGAPVRRGLGLWLWLRKASGRPRFLLTLDDPAYQLLRALRGWGTRVILDFGDPDDR